MVIRRERGQERPEKRTVGKSASTRRPRISKNESKGEKKNFGSERTGAPTLGKRIGKSRPSKFAERRDSRIGRESRGVKKLTTRSGSKSTAGEVREGVREKTSDVFRRNVIQKRLRKEPERTESDQYMEMKVGLIGSCTNSSYEDISRAASVAAQAKEKNLKMKADFTVSPGSEQVRYTIARDGFIKTFEEMGGLVLANACGPCIGQWARENVENIQENSIMKW